MANMARKEAPGLYVIGIYDVQRKHGWWIARGRDFGSERMAFPTLGAAHLHLTGEPMREPRKSKAA